MAGLFKKAMGFIGLPIEEEENGMEEIMQDEEIEQPKEETESED